MSTAISVTTSIGSSSCTITSQSRILALKLTKSESNPSTVQQDSSSRFHLVSSVLFKGSIPPVPLSASSSSLIATNPVTGVVDISTVPPTFGFKDQLWSQPTSLFVRKDGL